MKSKTQVIAALVMAVLLSALASAQSTSGDKKSSPPSGGKQDGVMTPQAGEPVVVGTGTPGRLPKWIGRSGANFVLGNSSITEDAGGNVTVAGTIQATGGTKVARDQTLKGDGTTASPLGVNVPLSLFGNQFAHTLVVGNFTENCIGCGAFVAKTNDNGIAITASIGPVIPRANTGLQGVTETGIGVLGQSGGKFGVAGEIFSSNDPNAAGIHGRSNTHSPAAIFTGNVKINGNNNGSSGDLSVAGTLNVTGTKNFKIDHPADPENKYLYHAAIESSEVLNIYSGNIVTDENGDAVVELPEWYDALNKDSRYQLTVVGSFARAIVGEKIKGNRFKVKTDAANVEVSWQVTGVRSDAAMRKRPFAAEELKAEAERGFYLDPEAYGQPEEKGVEWGRSPEIMQQLKQQRLEAQKRNQKDR